MIKINQNLFSKICTYAKKDILEGIYGNKRSGVNLVSIFTTENQVIVPLSCFTRNSIGDIVLYRGLKNIEIEECKHLASSVAAHQGRSAKDIISKFQSKGYETIESIATEYSGLTQSMDPILHTTTKRKMAISFAGNNGVLVEYHIPQEFLKQKGILGHLGENEIDFFHSIPQEYVAKVTKVKKTQKIQNNTNMLPQLPQIIHINI